MRFDILITELACWIKSGLVISLDLKLFEDLTYLKFEFVKSIFWAYWMKSDCSCQASILSQFTLLSIEENDFFFIALYKK
jgi:hypothetical protein